ncbi:hypothetical protein EO95_14835 [Methanosarcina sp. 1.H.T.1A.1]|uniref:glycosyltransferase family 4 protein n=1 Tax=Methanosarcina sp. 1.H.T.1A.1 TaxID=1483602 RepID=UPI000620E65D|nr:glycosyltransferase family 4 protein [Methanosarcina sp. 1.H.T.1A.1]KKH94289.1 hypothetical protein EO95_14835 [Methanosarcina sp. 1.H.T.1A.1]
MAKKIDLYCEGNCWDPKVWSVIPYELATTLKKLGSLGNTYNVCTYENTSRVSNYTHMLPYIRVGGQGIYSLRNGNNPSYYEKRQKKALKIYESNPKPDSIITIGHLAIFYKTPYFTLQDMDLNTVIKWRENKKPTYMFDKIPLSLLKKSEIIQRKVYENAAGIFVSSEWVKNNICSYIDEPKKVFPTGIGHRYSAIQLTEEILEKRFENPVLLFVGKDGIRKGIDIVIEAFEQIKNEFKNMTLRIITKQNQLPRQIKHLINNSPDIELYDSVEPERLAAMYTSSSLFLMPSRFEPFGKVFFEAMAFGLPVIGANSCAMPEFIIDDYNGYTPSARPEEVAKKIKKVFESFGKYKKLSKNAIVESNKYREENVVKEMLTIIDKYSI